MDESQSPRARPARSPPPRKPQNGQWSPEQRWLIPTPDADDTLYQYHARLNKLQAMEELWQKSKITAEQKAIYAECLLLDDEIHSPHIRAVVDLAWLCGPAGLIAKYGLLAISQEGWGGERLTDAITAKRYMAPRGASAEALMQQQGDVKP